MCPCVGQSGHSTDSLILPHRAMRLYRLETRFSSQLLCCCGEVAASSAVKGHFGNKKKKKTKLGTKQDFHISASTTKSSVGWYVLVIAPACRSNYGHCRCHRLFKSIESWFHNNGMKIWAPVASGNLDLTWFKGAGIIRASAVWCCVFATLLLLLLLLFQTGLPG